MNEARTRMQHLCICSRRESSRKERRVKLAEHGAERDIEGGDWKTEHEWNVSSDA